MKYLLEIHHGIGDIVQYTGLIRSVKTYDTEAFVGIVVNKESYKMLLALDRNVDCIHVIDFSRERKKLLKEILNIRKHKYDYMVCSIHSRQLSMEFMAVAFGAKMTVGSKLDRLCKIRKKYKKVTVNDNDHVVKQNNDVLQGIDTRIPVFEPYLNCPIPPFPTDKKTIGLCIGTSSPQKTWAIKNYIAVGEHFEKMGYSILLLGGKKEAEQYDASGYKNDKWINILGKTDLIESASECSLCELVIGGDTGLMHMAAAVGIRTLTLFSCSEPTTHAPYSRSSYYYYIPTACQFCFGTKKMKECKDYKCLNSIDVNGVVTIAENILYNPELVRKNKLKLE